MFQNLQSLHQYCTDGTPYLNIFGEALLVNGERSLSRQMLLSEFHRLIYRGEFRSIGEACFQEGQTIHLISEQLQTFQESTDALLESKSLFMRCIMKVCAFAKALFLKIRGEAQPSVHGLEEVFPGGLINEEWEFLWSHFDVFFAVASIAASEIISLRTEDIPVYDFEGATYFQSGCLNILSKMAGVHECLQHYFLGSQEVKFNRFFERFGMDFLTESNESDNGYLLSNNEWIELMETMVSLAKDDPFGSVVKECFKKEIRKLYLKMSELETEEKIALIHLEKLSGKSLENPSKILEKLLEIVRRCHKVTNHPKGQAFLNRIVAQLADHTSQLSEEEQELLALLQEICDRPIIQIEWERVYGYARPIQTYHSIFLLHSQTFRDIRGDSLTLDPRLFPRYIIQDYISARSSGALSFESLPQLILCADFLQDENVKTSLIRRLEKHLVSEMPVDLSLQDVRLLQSLHHFLVRVRPGAPISSVIEEKLLDYCLYLDEEDKDSQVLKAIQNFDLKGYLVSCKGDYAKNAQFYFSDGSPCTSRSTVEVLKRLQPLLPAIGSLHLFHIDNESKGLPLDSDVFPYLTQMTELQEFVGEGVSVSDPLLEALPKTIRSLTLNGEYRANSYVYSLYGPTTKVELSALQEMEELEFLSLRSINVDHLVLPSSLLECRLNKVDIKTCNFEELEKLHVLNLKAISFTSGIPFVFPLSLRDLILENCVGLKSGFGFNIPDLTSLESLDWEPPFISGSSDEVFEKQAEMIDVFQQLPTSLQKLKLDLKNFSSTIDLSFVLRLTDLKDMEVLSGFSSTLIFKAQHLPSTLERLSLAADRFEEFSLNRIPKGLKRFSIHMFSNSVEVDQQLAAVLPTLSLIAVSLSGISNPLKCIPKTVKYLALHHDTSVYFSRSVLDLFHSFGSLQHLSLRYAIGDFGGFAALLEALPDLNVTLYPGNFLLDEEDESLLPEEVRSRFQVIYD